MRLDEVAKFASTVYNILEKTVDKGVDVMIDLALVDSRSEFGDVKYGEILETNYWSTENIINIAYLVRTSTGVLRRDWRYRPLTGQMFDEEFTLKKVNGELTFMRREKSGE